MRRTRALEELLRELVERDTPATFSDLAASPRMAPQCDKATVYRLLVRLEENGLVRRLGSHGRSTYFYLNYPGEHHDYLICSECGTIEKLDIACPVEALEEEVARTSGYRRLYHELEFFGVCPDCT
jgi:Fur family ferric uptake transcriptional regulator